MGNKREKITGIYKITNMVNGHAYIGQSVDIHKRWRRHKADIKNINSEWHNSLICMAMRKYGIDNFEFKVLEECDFERLNEREIYWIAYYDTYHDGYNRTLGGDGLNIEPDEKTLGIFYDLENTELGNKEIGEKWGVSENMVCGINTGYYWYQENREYPIRKKKQKKVNYCIDCGKEISDSAKRCKLCADKEQSKREIQKTNRSIAKPTKKELQYHILRNSMCKVAKMYEVTDNAVRKWCKSYGLPYKNKDIMQMRTALGVTEYNNDVTNDAGKKSVERCDVKNNEVTKYDSIVTAAKAMVSEGKSYGSVDNVAKMIGECCRGKRKTIFGGVWKYVE